MTVRTQYIQLVYEGKVLRQVGTAKGSYPEFVINGWKKLYPKHLFEKCQILTDEGKEYHYEDYYIKKSEREPTVAEKQNNRKKVLKKLSGAIGNGTVTGFK